MIFERDRLAIGKARYSLQNSGAFKEEEHPRAADGKFGTGGVKSDKKTEKEISSKEEFSKKQKEQIQSKQFKNWFDGSKIVDKNGDPLIVYRGSTTKLKDGEIPEIIRGGSLGAAYFTTSKNVAEAYAKTSTPDLKKEKEKEARQAVKDYDPTITEVFLSIKNPATEKNIPEDVFSLEEMADFLSQFDSNLEYDQSKETVYKAIDKYTDLAFSGQTMPDNLRRLYAYADASGDLDRVYEKFDGVMFTDKEAGGTTIVPLKKNQIKSATDNIGEFNKESDNIENSKKIKVYRASR